MKVKQMTLVLMLVFAVSCTASAQIISNVVRANGDSAAAPLPTEEGGLKDGNLVFSDRAYVWAQTDTGTLGLDMPLIGSEYIRTYNNDKNAGGANVTYTVTITSVATVWVTVDDRFASAQDQVDQVTSAIGSAGTFVDTGLQLHVGGDGAAPGRPLSVYAADLPPGDYVFGASQGNNFYVIGAVLGDPSFDPAPVVNAGGEQAVYLEDAAQLAGVVADEGSLDGSSPGGVESFYWTQESGPGTADFSATDILYPTVTFDVKGVYELMLQATDGTSDANDIVMIRVKDRADESLLAHYPLDGDGLDISGNDYHLTARGDTAFVDGIINQAASFDGAGDDLIQVDPNSPIGGALNDEPGITVSCWVKSDIFDTDKGFVIFADPAGNDDYNMRYDENGGEGDDAVLKMGVTTTDGIRHLETSHRSQTTEWQHVVMTWESGGRIRGYINGVEDAYSEQSGVANGTLTGFGALILGRGGKDVAPDTGGWDGLIDDVRIYDYALPLVDPGYVGILDLTAMGPLVASVDAGADFDVVWKPFKEYVLPGAVTDNGKQDPENPNFILWEMLSSADGGTASFVGQTAGQAQAVVTFDKPDVYVMQLTVIDIDSPTPMIDTVTITADAPTCDDVKADGLQKATDLNGDCSVDIADLALLLADWMECNDPETALTNPELCDWPF